MTRQALAGLAALTALVLFASPAGAVRPPTRTPPSPNVDRRPLDRPVPPGQQRARAALARELGAEGVVSTDGRSGGVRLIARRNGYLAPSRAGSPGAIALEYVRDRPAVFGLEAADIDALRLTSGYRSGDGVTHLAYVQTYLGVAAYDNVLLANVDDGGRLLNVGGAAVADLQVSSVTPVLEATAALAIARRDVGGPLGAPPRASVDPGPEQPTRFSSGDSARLTLFHDGLVARLAWRVQVADERRVLFEVVVDAIRGEVLKRRSLTDFVSDAQVQDYFPGASSGGSTRRVDLAGDGTWLTRSSNNTRLRGNNVHAYADIDGEDVVGGPSPGDAEIPASGTDGWLYVSTPFSVPGQACPVLAGGPHCTWNSTDPARTRAQNRNQATTQLFYLVNRFHDHLKAAPIGFTHDARGFEHVDADGRGGAAGGDAVFAESDNLDAQNAVTLAETTNNAAMSVPPDGDSPYLEMFFFTNPSLNGADAADVVYHEYAHGLTRRTVGTGAGSLDAPQSKALGEGWSDWYALDFLAGPGQGHIADTAADGEVTIGGYLEPPRGFRQQGIDCPVGSAAATACPGNPSVGPGGFTFGDLGRIGTAVHDDGEIWGETLWDLRQALGSQTARMLVTGGLRLTPDNPSFLEARDAIIQADQAATRGANYAVLWQVFAARGMGHGASTQDSSATSATESFELPPSLRATSPPPPPPPPPAAATPPPPAVAPPPPAVAPPPPPPPPPPLTQDQPPRIAQPFSAEPSAAIAAAPARMQVLRAGVRRGRLDVLASIDARATGRVRVLYRTPGARTSLDAPIVNGRIRIRERLPRSQRSRPTGILTLTYAGTGAVEPERVTLRAAAGRARLVRTRSLIDAGGRLRVAGTIARRARGVVRMRLRYAGAGGSPRYVELRARIARGRWSLRQQLPAAAAESGGQLSIRFPGHARLRIEGQQIVKEVAPGR